MSKTKERILEQTAELFRRQGYTGTGLKQIVAAANAPFGSIYHFFPGGKEQLGTEVIKASGLMYQQLIEGIIDAATDIVSGVEDCFTGAAEVLKATDYADACPIATVALEVASVNEPLRQACADVFDGWVVAGTERIAAAGVPEARARALTIQLIMLLEGAFLLCRASKTTEAMKIAGDASVASIRAALPKRASPRRAR
jgi:AcrR family transcriptional regulator